MNFTSLSDRVGRLRWSQAALILLAFFLVANWQVLTGRAYERWDAYDLGAPNYSLLADFARAGRLLYWNPWIAGGSPDFAVAGSGVFSPDLLLFAAVTGMRGNAFLLFWMLVWLSGGMGMLLLARQLRAPVWGGLAVSLGFVFSGFYTGHAQHTSVLYSYSLLPWIIWRLDVALLEQKFLAATQTGVLWGFSGLAGYPELTFCTLALIFAWSIGRFFFARGEERVRNGRRSFLLVLTTVVLGLLVLAPSYFSVLYEGAGYSDRSEPITRAFALHSNALHPGALATLSSPALIDLKLLQRSLWSYTDVSSANLYLGGVSMLLACIGLTSNSERRFRCFLGGLAFFALACAISVALPLRGWLYDLVPLTRYFRHASMLRGLFMFLVAVLALLGARDLSQPHASFSNSRRLRFLAPLLAIVAALAFAITLISAKADHPEIFLAQLHFIFVWSALVLAAIYCSRTKYLPLALLTIAMVDGLMACHFSEGTMYSKAARPVLPLPDNAALDNGPAGFWRAPGHGSNINLFFKVPAFRSYAPFKNHYQEAIANDPVLGAMALGDDRIWFASAAPEIAPTQAAFDRFAQRVRELNAPILVRHARAQMLHAPAQPNNNIESIARAGRAIHIATHILEYSPDKLSLEVRAPNDGWLLVTERWSRSWRATVNGLAQPVEAADFIFRAVPVTKGINRIEFSFHPFGMPWLVLASWLVAGCVGALSLRTLWPRRQFARARYGLGILPNESALARTTP